MKRPYRTLLLGVILPCAVAVLAGLGVAIAARADLQAVSLARSARLATATAAHASLRGADGANRPAAEAPTPGLPVVPPTALGVTGVLLLVTAVVGWFGLRGGRTHRRPLAVRALVLLLSLASAASAWTFLLKLDGAVRTAGRNATVGDLTRGLAVVRALVPPDSVEAVRSMTGFQATLVSHHRVEATTLTGTREGAAATAATAAIAAIAAIRPPPPSFTASGPVTTSAGPSIYVALSLPRGDLLVVTAPSRREPITIFRRCAILIAACLALWLLGTSAIAWRTGLLSS